MFWRLGDLAYLDEVLSDGFFDELGSGFVSCFSLFDDFVYLFCEVCWDFDCYVVIHELSLICLFLNVFQSYMNHV